MQSELIHARIAMTAVAGILIPDVRSYPLTSCHSDLNLDIRDRSRLLRHILLSWR